MDDEFRQVRQIRTLEELNALPAESVVGVDRGPEYRTWRRLITENGNRNDWSGHIEEGWLPFDLLHLGGVTE